MYTMPQPWMHLPVHLYNSRPQIDKPLRTGCFVCFQSMCAACGQANSSLHKGWQYLHVQRLAHQNYIHVVILIWSLHLGVLQAQQAVMWCTGVSLELVLSSTGCNPAPKSHLSSCCSQNLFEGSP